MTRYTIMAATPRLVELFALGLAARALGILVYALDRPVGSVAFLPAEFVHDSGFLGPMAGSMPTFLVMQRFAPAQRAQT